MKHAALDVLRSSAYRVRHRSVLGLASVFVALMSGLASTASAQYPDKVVRVVVPFGPGGSTDAVARTAAQRLAEYWGKPVIVENKPGGAGTVGTAGVAKGPADGYTILMGVFAHAVIESLYKTTPYKLERDFIPVIEIGKTPQLLLVHPIYFQNHMQIHHQDHIRAVFQEQLRN